MSDEADYRSYARLSLTNYGLLVTVVRRWRWYPTWMPFGWREVRVTWTSTTGHWQPDA